MMDRMMNEYAIPCILQIQTGLGKIKEMSQNSKKKGKSD